MTKPFQMIQQQLTDAIRRSKPNEDGSIGSERLAIYRRLVRGSLNSVIRPCFPVLLSILPHNVWQKMIDELLQNHSFKSPYFHQAPLAMVTYLQEHPLPDYPFAGDLAHYEWVELNLDLSTALQPGCVISKQNRMETKVQLSPLARLLIYDYEVDKISVTNPLPDPKKTSIIAYRNEDNVKFIKLNQESYQSLYLMLEEQLSAEDLIQLLCTSSPELNQTVLLDSFRNLINLLCHERILVAVD